MRTLLITVILGLLALPAQATSHFVAAHCTNNGTGASSACAASPGGAGAWNSIPNISWGSVAAGDSIDLAPTQAETYTLAAQFAIGASGTTNTFITITATNLATLDCSFQTNGACVNFSGHTWIKFDGVNDCAGTHGSSTCNIKISGYNPTAGNNVYGFYENNGGGNITIRRVEVTGTGTLCSDDNCGGAYLQGTSVGGMVTDGMWVHTSSAPTKFRGTGVTIFCNTGTTNFNDCENKNDLIEYMFNDGLRCTGNCSIDNSEVDHVDGSGHSDSTLCQSGNYCAIFNNYVHDSGDQNCYIDNLNNATQAHIRVYNNVWNSNPGFGLVIDAEGGASSVWDDVVVANNTCYSTSAACVRNVNRGSYTNLVILNNIFGTNTDGSYHSMDYNPAPSFASSTAWDYNVYSTSSVNYPSIVNLAGTNETLTALRALSPARETHGITGIPIYANPAAANFQLSNSDTVAKGNGVNLTSTYSFLITDKAGASRPAVGAWDIGAYQASSATAPSFTSPASCPYTGPKTSATLNDPNIGTHITCYTLNGANPATNSLGTACNTGTAYAGSVPINTSLTMKAVAGTSTLSDSSVASCAFSIQSATPPSCSPAGGTFAGSTSSSCTNPNTGTTVMCETYGVSPATPATDGTGLGCLVGIAVSGPIPITFTGTLLVVAGTNTLLDSSVVSYNFTINPSAPGNELFQGGSVQGVSIH